MLTCVCNFFFWNYVIIFCTQAAIFFLREIVYVMDFFLDPTRVVLDQENSPGTSHGSRPTHNFEGFLVGDGLAKINITDVCNKGHKLDTKNNFFV